MLWDRLKLLSVVNFSRCANETETAVNETTQNGNGWRVKSRQLMCAWWMWDHRDAFFMRAVETARKIFNHLKNELFRSLFMDDKWRGPQPQHTKVSCQSHAEHVMFRTFKPKPTHKVGTFHIFSFNSSSELQSCSLSIIWFGQKCVKHKTSQIIELFRMVWSLVAR